MSWPRIVRVGLTEEEKIEHALALNLMRRHLSREQRQELVRKLRQRGLSLRRIAELLGVDDRTIRRDLSGAANAAPENTPEATGADGKTYPARQRTAGLMAGRSRAPGAGAEIETARLEHNTDCGNTWCWRNDYTPRPFRFAKWRA